MISKDRRLAVEGNHSSGRVNTSFRQTRATSYDESGMYTFQRYRFSFCRHSFLQCLAFTRLASALMEAYIRITCLVWLETKPCGFRPTYYPNKYLAAVFPNFLSFSSLSFTTRPLASDMRLSLYLLSISVTGISAIPPQENPNHSSLLRREPIPSSVYRTRAQSAVNLGFWLVGERCERLTAR